MNASRPEAETEYSRARRASAEAEPTSTRRSATARAAVLTLGVTGAAALIAAELTPLARVRTIAAHPQLVRTLQTGPHHAWALMPVALLALALTVYVWRTGARPGLAAVALLGAVALVIALGVDRPDARATGLVGSPATGLHNASVHAAIGLYLETLGAVLLLVAAAAGALLEPTTALRRRRSRPGHRTAAKE